MRRRMRPAAEPDDRREDAREGKAQLATAAAQLAMAAPVPPSAGESSGRQLGWWPDDVCTIGPNRLAQYEM